MSASNSNHIYKYDQERNKIIIIDSATGEEVQHNGDQLSRLLEYLDRENQTAILRKFSIWCARQPDVSWKPLVYKMFRTAEEYLHGEISENRLEELHQKTEGIAISTDSVGLRQGDLSAPLLLAARACIHPHACQAAVEAAHYHKLWVEMESGYQDSNLSDKKAKKIHQHLTEKAEELQINRILDFMNEQKMFKQTD